MIKEVNTEQAKKLDSILGFVEQTVSSSEVVRGMLEDFGKIEKVGLYNPSTDEPLRVVSHHKPLNPNKKSLHLCKPFTFLVAGIGFEPMTFGL